MQVRSERQEESPVRGWFPELNQSKRRLLDDQDER